MHIIDTQVHIEQKFRIEISENGELSIDLISCAQQTNGSNCGIFAISFMFEWATVAVNADLDVQYIIPDMRPHLIHCLAQKELQPFPNKCRCEDQDQEKSYLRQLYERESH